MIRVGELAEPMRVQNESADINQLDKRTMKTLTIWNPLQEMDAIHNRLSDAFYRTPFSNNHNGDATWMPAADIVEDEKTYRVTLELPGVAKENIEVKVEDDYLHLSGERKEAEKTEGTTLHRVERAHGKFARRFRLPKDADPANVKADYRDGVLTITLSKKEEALPKQIEVKVG